MLAFAVLLAVNVGRDPEADARNSKLFGKLAPDFDLPTLADGRVSLDSLSGKVVVVNFWNSWCIPCIQEHDALAAFYSRHASDPDFAMVGIVRDDTHGAVARWVQAKGDAWTIAFDPNSLTALNFGTRGQPETYVIDPEGQIVATQFGPVTVGNLETMLRRAREQ